MPADPEDEFIAFVKKTIDKSGFPDNKVALPREKVETAAKSKELDLDMILSRLKYESVYSSVTEEKIIFSSSEETKSESSGNPFENLGGLGDTFGGLDLEGLKNMSQEDIMGKVSGMMENMTPEQQEAMMNMYQNMSDEDKENIMNKGKDMGLF